jgi:hypothetical protein
MFRISLNGQEPVVDVDTLEQIEPVIRAAESGRYQVDEIRASNDRFPSGNCSRAWGTVIHQPDGRIAVKPFLWGAHVPAPIG